MGTKPLNFAEHIFLGIALSTFINYPSNHLIIINNFLVIVFYADCLPLIKMTLPDSKTSDHFEGSIIPNRVVMSVRNFDKSELLETLLDMTYQIYDEEGFDYKREKI